LADIFQEIDEDVRRDRLQHLWKRYGNYVVGAALLFVLATAAVVGWREYRERQNQAQAQRFIAAMDQATRGEDAAAKEAFAKLAADAGAGYATLARLQEAALLAKGGDAAGAAGAASIYERIAADSRVDQVFRDLAVVMIVQDTIATGEPAKLTQLLAPLLNDKNPWRHSATELSALLAQRAGDQAKAKELYTKLADDLGAPQNMRARATEMLAIIGG
jgi:hypothetical protein